MRRKLTPRLPLADQIYQIVLEDICSGQYPLGERLSQEQIAEQLNVSRQPVLQALGLLKAQGFLCSAGRRGLKVAPLDPELVRDLYEYRGAIDLMSASRAAGRAGSIDHAQANRIFEQGATARAAGSVIDLSVADMAFHQWLYLAAGNRTVIETMNHHWHHTRRVMCAILSMDDEWPDRVWNEHRSIYDAIAGGQVELAEHLAFDHVQKASQALQHELERKLEKIAS